MNAPTITLGGREVTLVAPSPLAVHALADSVLDNLGSRMAAGAAALRLCWPVGTTWLDRVEPRRWDASQGHILAWGHEIFDSLFASLDPEEFSRARVEAWNWSMSTVIRDSEVSAAEGFSEEPAED